MKRVLFLLVPLSLGLVAPVRTVAAASPPKVRDPAVAGMFYPADSATLTRTVDACLAAAKTERVGALKALICPHAGYAYSGPIAGSAFHLLHGTNFRTVIVLGPAHYAALDAASVSDADIFRTPLGEVSISPKARQLARLAPFALQPRCYVQRPDWAQRSVSLLPDRNTDYADTYEHSVEVEIPFLQRTLPKFELVPVVVGDVDPVAAANALARFVDDSTLIVVSSDLSHYHPYAEAQAMDRRCVEAITRLQPQRIDRDEACGRVPIQMLLYLAKQRGWEARLLDLRNSGDTSGQKSSVVGYAAVAFYAAPSAQTLTPADRRTLLELARQSVRQSARDGGLPPLSPAGLSAELSSRKAVFVTLTKHGQLRGCIGHIIAQMPLYRGVAENARNAALHDPRFSAVTPREVDQLEIEISVLTEPQPLAFSSPEDLLGKLQPGKDGVVLQIEAGTATYLPQVWEQLPDKVLFLDSLAEKAGGRSGDWRRPGTTVAIYHVESFRENE